MLSFPPPHISKRTTLLKAVSRYVFLLLPFPLFAQQAKFQHIGLDEGLSQDIVTAIAQDSLGFMWFGTEDGLNKYDGYGITVFKHNARDTNSLPSNVISTLMVDSRGRMWVATSRGVCIIEMDGRFLAPPELANGYALFCQGNEGDVWISTGAGLFRHMLDGRTLRISTGPVLWSGANAILLDHQHHRLLAGTMSGLSVFPISNDTLSLAQKTRGVELLRGKTVTALCQTTSGELFVTTRDDGLYRLDSNLEEARRYLHDLHDPTSLSDFRTLVLSEDSQQRLWVGTFSGLDRFDAATEKFVRYTSEDDGLRGDRVYSLCVERNGALWVGTYRGGVNRLDPRRQKFGHVGYQNHAGGLLAHEVFSLLETREEDLWVGTEAGLFRRRKNRDGFVHYTHDPRKPRSLRSRAVFSLFQRSNGEIWVGGDDGAVSRFEPRGEEFVRYDIPNANAIRVIYEAGSGPLLVGTEARGAFALDSVNQKFIPWQVRVDSVGSPAGVWAMRRDRKGFLWLGTFYIPYIVRIDPHTQIASHITADANEHALVTPSVRTFCETNDDALYLGTWGGGFARYDRSTDRYEWYGENEGLPSNYVKSMQSDDRGRLWIATEKGLARFDPRTESFRTYGVEDGLQSNFFWSGSSWKGKDGMLYFGGTNGFNMFHPDSIMENLDVPPVVITRMRVLDRPLRIPGDRAVTLTHDADFFSFEFVALDYTIPGRNQYAYKLEGFDRDWINAGTRRYAAYTHLDPGKYLFTVKGSNGDGVWNEEGASIAVTILPPYWMTWWFRGAIVLAVAAGLYGIYRYRLNQVLRVERLRQRIAQDLHDDIGTNLSAIVVASQVIRQQRLATPEVLHQVGDISSIALRTQELMRDIVWMLNPRNDTLQEFIGRMKHECALLFRGMDYSFTAPEGELQAKTTLEFKRNVFLIYKEMLNNTIKHAGATRVLVQINFDDSTLKVRVQDNGVGFDPERLYQGSGLLNMRNRAERIGASLRILSSPGNGSSIELEARIA